MLPGQITIFSEPVIIVLIKNLNTFQDFREKTKSLTFIQAAYRTKSVTANGIAAPNLNGDIVITVRKENTDLLFTVNNSKY